MSVDAPQLLARMWPRSLHASNWIGGGSLEPSPSPPFRESCPWRLAPRLGEPRTTPSGGVAANVCAPDAEDLVYTLRETADDLGAARLSDAI